MADNVYEGMFILDSGQYGRNHDEVSGRINKLIEDAGGEILVSRIWMDGRRLAYPINGHRKGTYWLTYFKLTGTALADLNRQTQLTDVVLRHLFLKVDPRIVDALVEHAKAGPSVEEIGDDRRPRRPATAPRVAEAAAAAAAKKAEAEAAADDDTNDDDDE